MIIILFQPDIPQNTGNIIRTCALTNSKLILVRPFGFSTSSRKMKRAGLDYLKDIQMEEIDDLDSYLENTSFPYFFLSSKVNKPYTEVKYDKNSILIFGSEKHGLPEKYFNKYKNSFLTIPMKEKARCLNLSNSVSIVLYEALRQQNFNFSC
jgi:tRNA (cytidine/uridine-2'-O-)-methyltransferase